MDSNTDHFTLRCTCGVMNVMIATYIFFSYSPLSTPHKYTGENYPPGTTLILLAILFLLPSIPFPSLPLLIYRCHFDSPRKWGF